MSKENLKKGTKKLQKKKTRTQAQQMRVRELREAVDTDTELLRTYQLNIDPLETLELTSISVREFC